MDVYRNVSQAFVLCLVFAVAGCSDPQQGAAAQATQGSGLEGGDPRGTIIDPCRLISREEAEKIMGSPLGQGPSSERKAVGLKICLYEPSDLSPGLFQVSLTQSAFMSEEVLSFGQNPTTIFNTTKENFPQRTEVNGVGDEAFIAPPGLHILYRGYYVVIAVGNSSNAENRVKLEQAGKQAVASLQALLH